MPQHYWKPGVVAQIGASNGCTPLGRVVLPLLTASHKLDAAGVLSLAQYAIANCQGFDGLAKRKHAIASGVEERLGYAMTATSSDATSKP